MNHRSLINELGGPRKVIEHLREMTGEELSLDCVRKWKQQGVPWKWRLPVVALARELGKDKAVPKEFLPRMSLSPLRVVA